MPTLAQLHAQMDVAAASWRQAFAARNSADMRKYRAQVKSLMSRCLSFKV